MKKILSLVALMATLIPALSFAAPVRVEREIGWGSYANGVLSTATIGARPLAGATPDTSAVFSMSDVAILGGGFPVGNGVSTTGGFSANDSLCVGYIVGYRDSTAAGTTNLTAVTASLQASYDQFTWAGAGTVTQAPSSGDPVFVLPIFVVPGSGPTWNITAPRLRLAFTTTTGQMPACRLKLVYWADNDRR